MHSELKQAGASRRLRGRGFSMIELLIALTISATIMASTLVALDVLFKRFTSISEGASTQVLARTVMHRMLALVRTGDEFGPYPGDVLDPDENPIVGDRIQFVSAEDPDADLREVTTLEVRDATSVSIGSVTQNLRGPKVIWLIVDRTVGSEVTRTERPLLDGVLRATFELEYDIGPRLRRATIDMTVMPQGNSYAEYDGERQAWVVNEWDAQRGEFVEKALMANADRIEPIRLVASTSPRSLEDTGP